MVTRWAGCGSSQEAPSPVGRKEESVEEQFEVQQAILLSV